MALLQQDFFNSFDNFAFIVDDEDIHGDDSYRRSLTQVFTSVKPAPYPVDRFCGLYSPEEVCMPQVLLVEDAKDCQVIVRETLAKVAEVKIAPTLGEARALLRRERFDLMILDMNLPDGDGLEFFSEIQSQEVPVIFLTAKGEAAMQVTAFSLGADDYIVKPLRPIEFRARVEAKLKKLAHRRSIDTTLVRGDLRIELGAQRATLVGEGGERRDLDLTGREFKLLYHLARHEGTVFSREQLIAAVWGESVHVLDRTVDTHVYTLRKKLDTHAHYVESEVGLGYRLNTAGKRGASKKGKMAA
jgi:two-component system catabolic regulation response regulator CreB